eukprot:CAMPEP_0198125834 /NCGR_PEP_ID=MMETSP1442-20131203/43489_1 /TAXON_ID= /ORGANISM="Craspedostauros australis, Strain CCMP3328" /LENGTH=367 /DNA_ID=CAMNT_0043785509 /DNA_START=144 /DNA_END=1247 /DNA_ORIENTATION=+
MPYPAEVAKALDMLTDSERNAVNEYIDGLKSKIKDLGGSLDEDKPADMDADGGEKADVEEAATSNADFPPLYESGDDMEKAGEFKQSAADFKSQGKWEEALDMYTKAVLCAPPSAMLYGNRALALIKLERYEAAERDCDEALKINPDSAKALKARGKARKALENWEGALSDLGQAQTIDFDPDVVEDLKFLTEKHVEQEKKEAKERIEEEEKLRKRAEEIKKANEEVAEEEEKQKTDRSPAGAGMPDMSGMPGMGGMGGMMEMMMNDPEMKEAMKNPKVIAAFQEIMQAPGGPMGLMSNPAKLQEMMADPEVGPVMQKLMAKLGPSMMGGMGGGMPGSGGAAGGSGGGAPSGDADDIPDLDDLPDLD